MGEIFCQVIKISELAQERPSITSGNQAWKGAKPSLVAKAVFIIRLSMKIIEEDLYRKSQIAENKMIEEAMDWIKKYLIEDSAAFLVSLGKFIIGIKDKIFNSRPNHILKNEEDETTINVLVIKKNT